MTHTKSFNLSTILIQFFLGAGFVLALNLIGNSSMQQDWTSGTWLVLVGTCLVGGAGAHFLARQLENKNSRPLPGADEARANVCFWVTLASASIGAVLMGSAWIDDLYSKAPELDSCCSRAAALKADR